MSLPPQSAGAAPDPSMEDILASIRRILSEDEAPAAATSAAPPSAAPPGAALDTGDVLTLDSSMLVEEAPAPGQTVALAPARVFEGAPAAPSRPSPERAEVHRAPEPAAVLSGIDGLDDLDFNPPPLAPRPPEPRPVMTPPPPAPPPRLAAEAESLVAPEAAAAAASSMGSLLRKLAAERATPVNRGGGVTIEDIVRDEMRPMLKEWLDAHLPAMVERLVRAEIERVVTGSLG